MDNHSENNENASPQQPEYVDFFNANTGEIVRLSVVRRLFYFFNPVTGECTGCADARNGRKATARKTALLN